MKILYALPNGSTSVINVVSEQQAADIRAMGLTPIKPVRIHEPEHIVAHSKGKRAFAPVIR